MLTETGGNVALAFERRADDHDSVAAAEASPSGPSGEMPSDSNTNDLREAAVQRTNVSVGVSHSEWALKAIYIVKSNYLSSMREYLISVLNRAEHIIKIKKEKEEESESGWGWGGLFFDEGGLLNRGISLYTIQRSLFNYFPT